MNALLLLKTRLRLLLPLGLMVLPLLLAQPLRAQNRALVAGTVAAAAGEPVPFATVTLHRAADSVVVKSEFTDERGAFRVEGPVGERYRVSVAQVGWERYWSAPFELPAAGVVLDGITLRSAAATNLQEVRVVGEKPLFERQADRTIVNVEGSTLAAGANSLEVLQRAPGVTVDNNDNLALRGRQGVLVILDGKRVPMTGTELAALLRSLPAEQLKNIELITNPPAKYDAQGTAGVIVINLRKDQRQGANATLNASQGWGFYDEHLRSRAKFNGGLNLNYRRKRVNVFGAYNYTDRHGVGKLSIERDFIGEGGERLGGSRQENKFLGNYLSHAWRAGLDWNVTDRTVVGVAASGLDGRRNDQGANQTEQYDAPGAVVARYRSAITERNHLPNATGNLNLKHTFREDSAGTRELTADADYATYRNARLQTLNTLAEAGVAPSSVLEGDQRRTLRIQSLKADYGHALKRGWRLETGGKASYVTADNDVVFYRTENGIRSLDTNQSNRFRYTENINAGYLTVSGERPGGSFSVGLRGEHTVATGRQDVNNERFDRNYFQLFPSGSVKRVFSERHETAFSLSRRIDRPSYNQLNPFRSWIDATTYGAGNKDLLPQTSYNLELTHTWRQKYSATLAYGRTRRPIVDVVQPAEVRPDGVVIVASTTVNLDLQHNYSLTLTAPVEPAPWWTLYANVVGYYNRFQGNTAGTRIDGGRPTFTLSANNAFKLGKGWSADVNGTYQYREVYAYFNQSPYANVTTGVQKTFAQGRGTVRCNLTDVFYTAPVHVTSTYRRYVERFYQRGDSRSITVALTYRVGNQKMAPTRRRQGGAEDEKRRAG